MGSGYHGGFGNTEGSCNIQPISSETDVEYVEAKMQDYLLNLNHPIGKSKAKYFIETLGYSKNDGLLLHKNIVTSIIGKKPIKTVKTPHGLKHEFHTKITGVNGKIVDTKIVTIIQKDNNKIKYKIITVYPNKKEEN